MNVSGRRVPILLVVSVLTAAMLLPVFSPHKAAAAQITNRSLTLLPGATAGGSKPGGVVNHKFTFTLPTSGTVGSIKFEYCTVASVDACVVPTGLVTTSATLAAQSGATGFTLVNTTNGAPYLTRTAASITGPLTVSYELDTVTNPTTANYTFFVRISTYTGTDGATGVVDTGSVAASTANPIVLTGTMPESLIFCTGATITTTSGIPDCTTATAGNITFNQLFSPTDTATATSQMAASTNALSGYSITVAGTTLTSGSNTIPAMMTAATSQKGVGQFGMNLMANTAASAASFPGNSANIAPASNGTDLKGQPATGYDTADTFKYGTGDSIAQSNNGGTLGPTNSQIYTSSYIVNVSGAQPAGTYSTTLTYVCTATF